MLKIRISQLSILENVLYSNIGCELTDVTYFGRPETPCAHAYNIYYYIRIIFVIIIIIWSR